VELSYHPLFAAWLEQLDGDLPAVAVEVQALIDSLEMYGWISEIPSPTPSSHPALGCKP
jgi:hypothetical protein